LESFKLSKSQNNNKMTQVKKVDWLNRQFVSGLPVGMLPFYLERLSGTLVRLEKKVTGLSEYLLSHKLDGKWSVKQNIGHLAEIDEVANKRIEEMMKGVSPMSPAIFEPRHDYNAMPVQQVLTLFNEHRAKNLERYNTLSGDDLAKSSLHPRLKIIMTPVDLAFFDAEHDDHHLVRISEIIQTLNTHQPNNNS
jgi:hypothetical protein